jgi:hypothetical protein
MADGVTRLTEPTVSVQERGAEGNARLTALIGLVLTVLLLIEGFTILDVRGLLSLHMFIGLMLIPPVLLKTATTVYRFGSYYARRDAYVRRGPPHLILRVIGPLVVLSTLAVVGTGVWLLAIGHNSDTVLTLHQGSFIVWVALMTVHFLAHALQAALVGWRDLARRRDDPGRRRRGLRLAVVAASLLVGAGLAAAAMPSSPSGWHRFDGHHISRNH